MKQNEEITKKIIRVRAILSELKKVMIAFSGGIDSTLLLKLAVDTLGAENVTAVTAVGPIHPIWEKAQSEELARLIGVKQIFIENNALEQKAFTENTAKRCYHCKKSLLKQLLNLALDLNAGEVIAGENADDESAYRPGKQAMLELNIRCPLKEAGLTKAEIRRIAEQCDLPNFNQPSSPCLATRVNYGQTITPELLTKIQSAEELLRDLNFKIFRVRIHGPLAKIEVDPSEIDRFFEPELRRTILTKFRELGFTFVTVDLAGYESGSLDKLIDTTGQL